MPRISNGAPRAQNDTDMMDTASRLREPRMRGAMHEDRDAVQDARNTPRMETTDYTWRRPSNLDAPEPRPGYRQRWVRAEFRSEADNLNWQAKVREGWRPRDPQTVPEYEAFFGQGSHMDKAVIRVGGLILMEIPEQQLRAKRRALDEQTARQEASVAQETDKISRDGRMQGAPPIVRDERVNVTTGRRPETMAD